MNEDFFFSFLLFGSKLRQPVQKDVLLLLWVIANWAQWHLGVRWQCDGVCGRFSVEWCGIGQHFEHKLTAMENKRNQPYHKVPYGGLNIFESKNLLLHSPSKGGTYTPWTAFSNRTMNTLIRRGEWISFYLRPKFKRLPISEIPNHKSEYLSNNQITFAHRLSISATIGQCAGAIETFSWENQHPKTETASLWTGCIQCRRPANL